MLLVGGDGSGLQAQGVIAESAFPDNSHTASPKTARKAIPSLGSEMRSTANPGRADPNTPVPDPHAEPAQRMPHVGQAGGLFRGPATQCYIRIRTNRVAREVGLGAGKVVVSVRRHGGHEVAFDGAGGDVWGLGLWTAEVV